MFRPDDGGFDSAGRAGRGTVFYDACWDGDCVDFREARALINEYFPGQMFEFWREAQEFIFRKEDLIRCVADALAKPPYRLLETEFMALVLAFVIGENQHARAR